MELIKASLEEMARQEAIAYLEFIGIGKAIKTNYSVEMVIRGTDFYKSDSISLGRFAADINTYLHSARRQKLDSFVDVDFEISEDNRVIHLDSENKGSLIKVVMAILEYSRIAPQFTLTVE